MVLDQGIGDYIQIIKDYVWVDSPLVLDGYGIDSGCSL